MRYVKTIIRLSDNSGYLINNKVIIDNKGTLWNDFTNIKPYRDFPQYYFKLSNLLTQRG